MNFQLLDFFILKVCLLQLHRVETCFLPSPVISAGEGCAGGPGPSSEPAVSSERGRGGRGGLSWAGIAVHQVTWADRLRQARVPEPGSGQFP